MTKEQLQAENKRLREALEKIKIIAINPYDGMPMLVDEEFSITDITVLALGRINNIINEVLNEK